MSQFAPSVRGTLNFAADRSDGGRFSNFDASERDASFVGVEVEIANVRLLPQRPSLDQEGFVIAAHEASAPDWANPQWLESVYVPSCLELVKRLTGARATLQMYYPIVRRQNADGAPPATFVHLDQTRDFYQSQAAAAAASHSAAIAARWAG